MISNPKKLVKVIVCKSFSAPQKRYPILVLFTPLTTTPSLPLPSFQGEGNEERRALYFLETLQRAERTQERLALRLIVQAIVFSCSRIEITISFSLLKGLLQKMWCLWALPLLGLAVRVSSEGEFGSYFPS